MGSRIHTDGETGLRWMPTSSPAAEALLPQIKRLPRLSTVVDDFVALSRKEYCTAREFEKVVNRDPELHAWLIRQANSGFFNTKRPIRTIADASVVIGLESLKRMVYAVCSRDLLRHRMSCYHLPGNGFWLHSLGVAVTARHLIGASSRPLEISLSAEEAFVAGLLHDLSKRILDECMSKRGGQRLIERQDEIDICGLDHADLSARVISRWGLPGVIGEAVCYHHEPDFGGAMCTGAALLYLSDFICNTWGVGIWTYPKLELEVRFKPYRPLLDAVGLQPEGMERLLEQLRPTLAGLDEMLRILGNNPVSSGDALSSELPADPAESSPAKSSRSRRGNRRKDESKQTGRQRRQGQTYQQRRSNRRRR